MLYKCFVFTGIAVCKSTGYFDNVNPTSELHTNINYIFQDGAQTLIMLITTYVLFFSNVGLFVTMGLELEKHGVCNI